MVDALMPASMILPAERPSSSPVPPSESSSSSSVSDEEGPPIPADVEEHVNPSLWQDKKGEVRKLLSNFIPRKYYPPPLIFYSYPAKKSKSTWRQTLHMTWLTYDDARFN